MPTIIVGRFQLQEQASGAVRALQAAGFDGQNGASFFANPSGQPDPYAVGSDDLDDWPSEAADLTDHRPGGGLGKYDAHVYEWKLARAKLIAADAAPRVKARLSYAADNIYAAEHRRREADEIGARVVAAEAQRLARAPRRLHGHTRGSLIGADAEFCRCALAAV